MENIWDTMGESPTVESLLDEAKESNKMFVDQSKKIEELQKVTVVLSNTMGNVLQILRDHGSKLEVLGTIALGHEKIITEKETILARDEKIYGPEEEIAGKDLEKMKEQNQLLTERLNSLLSDPATVPRRLLTEALEKTRSQKRRIDELETCLSRIETMAKETF